MTTYVMRNGQLVPKVNAAPISRVNGPSVQSDNMDATWHPADGKMYDSRSRFRNVTRSHGCIEVGNERQRETRNPYAGSAVNDVMDAVRKVNGGYRPHVQRENFDG